MFVIAVCREWVVREDNALAQQLQSQESEFLFYLNLFKSLLTLRNCFSKLWFCFIYFS